MILSSGERAVWAAAFVHALDNLPGGRDDEGRDESAAVVATDAVQRLRGAKCMCGIPDCNTNLMIRAMLGEE